MKNLSKEYARALFEFSREENIENAIFEEFAMISKMFEDNPAYIKILSSQIIGKNEKNNIIDSTFKSRINNYLLNFLKIMAENRQICFLSECFKEYESIYDKNNNILKVTAHTCVSMNQTQIKKLILKLESITKKKVFISNKIDSSLMGGIKISYDEKCIDLSLENYFEKLGISLESNNFER